MLLLALACSDYQLNRQEDAPGAIDSGIDDVCDNFAAEAGEVDMLQECIIEPVVGGWTPQLEWQNEAVGDTYTTPVVGHLDDDGTPEVAVANGAGVLFVLDGVTGEVEWSGGSVGAEPMTAAIGDLDGDGQAEAVLSGAYGTYAFRGDGTTLWQTSSDRRASAMLAEERSKWTSRADPRPAAWSSCASPTVSMPVPPPANRTRSGSPWPVGRRPPQTWWAMRHSSPVRACRQVAGPASHGG